VNRQIAVGESKYGVTGDLAAICMSQGGHVTYFSNLKTLDSSPGCLGATREVWWTWRSHAARTSVFLAVCGCVSWGVWRRAVLLQTSVQDVNATRAGCDSYFGQ